jgi:hypothetical protein
MGGRPSRLRDKSSKMHAFARGATRETLTSEKEKIMSLDRTHENDKIEGMKAMLLEQFQRSVKFGTSDHSIAAAESAKAYGMLVQTQLSLENKQ